MRHRRRILAAVSVAFLAAAGAAFASLTTFKSLMEKTAASGLPGGMSQHLAAAQGQVVPADVRRAFLPGQLRPALRALGDRVERPGKERLALAGSVRRKGEAEAAPFSSVYEQPGRLRFEEGQGAARRVLVFDRRRPGGGERTSTADEMRVIEALAYDTAEGFFDAVMDGAALRLIGGRVRADDGTAEGYAGPHYDIYQAVWRADGGGELSRLFLFNSDTQLLELVRYKAGRGGVEADVEVRITDWQRAQDQMVPGRVVLTEGGEPVLTLTITSAATGPAAEDGVFAPAR